MCTNLQIDLSSVEKAIPPKTREEWQQRENWFVAWKVVVANDGVRSFWNRSYIWQNGLNVPLPTNRSVTSRNLGSGFFHAWINRKDAIRAARAAWTDTARIMPVYFCPYKAFAVGPDDDGRMCVALTECVVDFNQLEHAK